MKRVLAAIVFCAGATVYATDVNADRLQILLYILVLTAISVPYVLRWRQRLVPS